jgi:hypothetical protein
VHTAYYIQYYHNARPILVSEYDYSIVCHDYLWVLVSQSCCNYYSVLQYGVQHLQSTKVGA